jgi:hypothetical protein
MSVPRRRGLALLSAPVPVIAYAQDASLSLAEQIRTKIAELEREAIEAVVDAADAAAEEEEEAVDAEDGWLDYGAAPAPTTTPRSSTVRLPKASQVRHDPRTLWALAVEEPNSNNNGSSFSGSSSSKRRCGATKARLEQADRLALKLKKIRQHQQHQHARMEDKQFHRAREDKMMAESVQV